jgi:pimeloyl-ACP methyl ester carboxylesterase
MTIQPTRVFIHGLESSGQGTKGIFFGERFPDMIIEDYTGSFSERMDKLEGLLAGKDSLILVGSSYGGLMAAVYAGRHEDRVKKLLLLAPALHLSTSQPYLLKKLQVPATIYHGRQDDIVPLEELRAIADQVFMNLDFNVVEDDHVLHKTFPILAWDKLLSLQE